MKPTKQTVYLPVKETNLEDNYLQDLDGDFYLEQKGYFFTQEQLNEYTESVIEQALDTAAENTLYDLDGGECMEFTIKESILSTFTRTYNKFKV